MGSNVESTQRAEQGKPLEVSPAAGGGPVPDSLRRVFRVTLGRVSWRAYSLFVIVLAIWATFQFLTNGLFLTPRNLSILGLQFLATALLSLGMLLIIVSGNIDLSPGSAVYFLAVMAALLQVRMGWPTAAVVVVMLALGVIIGVIHGLCVTRLGIPAFIVTLASQLYLRGIGLVITRGYNISPMRDSFLVFANAKLGRNLTYVVIGVLYVLYLGCTARRRIVRTRRHLPVRPLGPSVAAALAVLLIVLVTGWLYTGGLPVPILALGVMVWVWTFLTRNTRFGRHVYAIGGNLEASRLAGVSVGRVVLGVFAIMGLLYGLASMYLTARLNGAPIQMSVFLEMDVIGACIIGGTSLLGGEGNVVGVIVGALLMESLNNGMSLMGLQGFWQYVSRGFVLLLAVWIDVTVGAKARRS